jgi:hypothetical protein
MILDQVQEFASPEEALKHYAIVHISEEPWSNYTKADYSIEQWHSACLIHTHEGAPTSKSQCKLPVKTPNGVLNRNGVHAAAAALGGARGGLKGVSADQKKKASNALKRYYSQLDEDPPESLEHHGVKGMRWGVRKAPVEGSAFKGSFQSVGTFRKYAPGVMSRRSEVRFGLLGAFALFDPQVRAEVKAANRQVKLSKADKGWEKGLNNGSAWVEVNNASAEHFNKHIGAVNKKYPDDRNWANEDYRNPKSADFKRYMKDIDKLTQDSIEHASNKLNLMNPSGTKKVKIGSNGPGDYILTVEEVKHADDSSIRIKVDYQFDALGRVTGFSYSDDRDSLAQTVDLGVEFLKHHGVKGMRWGVRNEDKSSGRDTARKNEITKGKLEPGLPEFKQRVERVTGTHRPQTLRAPSQGESGRVGVQSQEKHGLSSRDKKILLGVGAVGVGVAGYVAYRHFSGNQMPGLELQKAKQEVQALENMKLPANWDVKGLKNGPISTQRLGDLAGGQVNAKLHDIDNLVINTSRGYADILPKGGFDRAFAAEQHDSMIRVLEQMRERYPAVRNLNVEVVPMSKVPGLEGSSAYAAVMSMRAGEARIMYNDLIDAPTVADIRRNRRFLPGLGAKDYIMNHEMGHLLAVAHGDQPACLDLLGGPTATPMAWKRWEVAGPLLHKKMFVKHGFTFKELSKLSQYAATEPAESMAELAGHYFTPEMRSRLTPDQITRAKAMFDEMGGVT